MNDDERVVNTYYVPNNIKRDYSIGPFKLLGLIEGVALGVITYFLTKLVPIKYDAIKLAFQMICVACVFIFAARGIATYSLMEYAFIIIRYHLHSDNLEFQKKFKKNSLASGNYNTQGIVIEKSIGDGIVRLKDGRFIGIVQLSGRNLFAKTAREQDVIIQGLANRLKIMPVRAQFISYTRSTNPFDYIDQIKEATSGETEPDVFDEVNDYIELCRTQIAYNTDEKTFLVVFSSDALDKSVHTETARMDQLKRCMSEFEGYLAQNGMSSRLSSNPETYREQIEQILYKVYNPYSAAKNKQADGERLQKLMCAFQLANKDTKEPMRLPQDIPLSYLVAPIVFDDRTSPNYIFADDCYMSFYYIKQNSYPEVGIGPGFIASLYHEAGVDYHVFYEKLDPDKFLSSLHLAANISSKMEDVSNNESRLKEEIQSTNGAAMYLKNELQAGNLPFNAGVLISIRAPQYEMLLEMEENLKKELSLRDIKIASCKYLQREAYLSTRLGNQVHPKLWKKMRQNMPASTLAAFYPFVETKMEDNNPIFLGVTESTTSTPVFFNPLDTARHDNANIVVFGSSGKGKTFFSLLLALKARLMFTYVDEYGRRKKPAIFIIAPIKGDEYEGLCEILHGNNVCINAVTKENGESAGQTINIMEIYPVLVERRKFAPSLLLSKVNAITAFVRFVMKDMSAVERRFLEECIIKTYARFGITRDNESVWADKQKRIRKKMPILEDLINEVLAYAEKEPRAANLASIMTYFSKDTGSLSYFNNETNIDLESGVTVFDLSALDDEKKTIAMFAVTELIQSYFEMDQDCNKILLVDEIWMLLENELSSKVVITWARTIRGKGGALISASQQLSDMFRHEDGGVLANQADTKMLLGMKDTDLEYTAKALNLSESIQDMLRDRPRGHGVLITRDETTPLAVLGSGHNMFVFSTDPHIKRIRGKCLTIEEKRYVEQMLADGVEATEIEEKFNAYLTEKIRREKESRDRNEEEMISQLGEATEEVIEEDSQEVISYANEFNLENEYLPMDEEVEEITDEEDDEVLQIYNQMMKEKQEQESYIQQVPQTAEELEVKEPIVEKVNAVPKPPVRRREAPPEQTEPTIKASKPPVKRRQAVPEFEAESPKKVSKPPVRRRIKTSDIDIESEE